jgi:hypothetical protein
MMGSGRLRDDLLALESKQKDEGGEKRDEGKRLQPSQQRVESTRRSVRGQPSPKELGDRDRDEDVKHDRDRQGCPTER